MKFLHSDGKAIYLKIIRNFVEAFLNTNLLAQEGERERESESENVNGILFLT